MSLNDLPLRRRDLLQLAAASALPGWGSAGARTSASAGSGAAGSDYRALVCIFMYGGNDGNNLVVPLDTTPYGNYQRSRSKLAMPQDQLLPLSLSNTGGARYGLHPAMTGMQALVNAGEAAVLANVGTLVVPTTPAQYLARSVPLPVNLFSHSDQQGVWQSSISDGPPKSGWAGRMLERLVATGAVNRGYSAVSLAGGNVWELSDGPLMAYRVSPSGNFGLDFYTPGSTADPLSAAITSLLAESLADPFGQTWVNMVARSIDNQRVLTSALAGATLNTVFPDTDIGVQLKMAARLMQVRGTLGLSQQCFFCSQGGFDTHGDDQLVTQNDLLGQVDAAISAFHAATLELGLADQATLFTASDFGRTLASNGAGSDHAWGSHQFVMGGAVDGGRMLGQFPSLVVGGADDVGGGVWVPSIAVDQLGVSLARWFGADDATLSAIFPRRGNFDDLALMKA